METNEAPIDWIAELNALTVRFEKTVDSVKENADRFVAELKKDRKEFETKKINLAKSSSLA